MAKQTGGKKVLELPGLKGKGVERVSLPAIDALCDAYIIERDRRLKQTPKEVAAKLKLIEALHRHAAKLQQPDGSLLYNYDELIIRLEHGKDKLKVESITHDDD
jgi:hypothetical protein